MKLKNLQALNRNTGASMGGGRFHRDQDPPFPLQITFSGYFRAIIALWIAGSSLPLTNNEDFFILLGRLDAPFQKRFTRPKNKTD